MNFNGDILDPNIVSKCGFEINKYKRKAPNCLKNNSGVQTIFEIAYIV